MSRRANLKIDALQKLAKTIPIYTTPTPLVLERPPKALQMGEFLAQLHATAEEARLSMEKKSEIAVLWDSIKAHLAMLFKSVAKGV